MRRAFVIALVLAVLGWTAPAGAKIGTIDQVPAATLLLPYFEVDLDNVNGVQTLFSINNASATAILAHVTIWSDLSVPMLFFDVYLTGYDVQTINLRDIFTSPGTLPRTASVGQDPGGGGSGGISPHGPVSQDINFASCSGSLPYPTLDSISPLYIPHLQQGLTGGPSPIYGGKCTGQALGDRIARGYVTIDTVNSCNVLSPADMLTGYSSVLTFQNVLWGDYFYVNSGQNFAQGETLVHIEANQTAFVPGDYTFYGRYDNFTALDAREPLATNFAARYLNGGPFTGGTSLITWRDSKVKQQPFNCPALAGVRPPWYPLGQEGLVVFDEQENPSVIPSFPVAPQPPSPNPIPFPAEANRTKVGSSKLPVPFTFGWIYLNLNTTVSGSVNPLDPAAAQGWVVTVHDADGRFSVGYDALQLDSARKALHFQPGP
jgi:hypothetical protein